MTTDPHRIAIGQISAACNDLEHNLETIARNVERAIGQGAEVIIFPEMALSGYLVDERFTEAARRLDSPDVGRLCELSRDIDICVGFIEESKAAIFYNSALFLSGGEIRHLHRKIYLPTYGQFDERRYYGSGWDVSAFETRAARTAMLICGDAWHLPLAYMAAHDRADVLVIIAASSVDGLAGATPCNEAWRWMCGCYALTLSCFVIFANQAGTNCEGDFWGGSFVVGPAGNIIYQSKTDGEDLLIADIDLRDLRAQRIKLPFRRDDSLAHTLGLGQRILDAKVRRELPFGEQRSDEPPPPKPR